MFRNLFAVVLLVGSQFLLAQQEREATSGEKVTPAVSNSVTATGEDLANKEVAEEKKKPEKAPSPKETQGQSEVEKLESLNKRIMATAYDWIDSSCGNHLSMKVLGIPLWRHLGAFIGLLLTFTFSLLVRRFLRGYMARLVERSNSLLDDMICTSAVAPTALLINSLGIYFSLMFMLYGAVPEGVTSWMYRLALALVAGAIFWYAYRGIDILDHYLRRLALRSDNDLDNSLVEVIRRSLRIILISAGVLVIGKYILDWNIAALITGAGVAGLAVAFAAQDTIANLFGTFMILLDRPFHVGERVIIGSSDGTVESVGIRSTRIRTLDGNQVSIPNKITADSVIENVGRRPHIKRVFTIGLVYDTPYEKMVEAVDILNEIFANHEGLDKEFPPRIGFGEFADYSLNINLTLWYHDELPVDWWAYKSWCNKTNFEILKRFNQAGLEFAFPTQTMYLAHDDNRPLTLNTRAVQD